MSQDLPADDRTKLVPSVDEIQERAYELWDRHHRPDGYDLHFWVMAERELKAERKARLERKGR